MGRPVLTGLDFLLFAGPGFLDRGITSCPLLSCFLSCLLPALRKLKGCPVSSPFVPLLKAVRDRKPQLAAYLPWDRCVFGLYCFLLWRSGTCTGTVLIEAHLAGRQRCEGEPQELGQRPGGGIGGGGECSVVSNFDAIGFGPSDAKLLFLKHHGQVRQDQ